MDHIVDSHNHLGTRKGEVFPADEILRRMDRAGVERAVVTTHPEQIDNDYIAAACRAHPDRLIGYAVVNPWLQESEDELRRCIETLGLVGLKLNSLRHGFAIDRHELMDPFFAICDEARIPLLNHGGSEVFNTATKFEEVARTFPNLVLIIAHMGMPDATHGAFRAATLFPNVYLDTASVDVITLRRALATAGPAKVLMATDASWGTFELSLEVVDAATDDPAARAAIKGGNFLGILARRTEAVGVR
jgi:predicted TIM-barrel fold metal-dependent hydrolase